MFSKQLRKIIVFKSENFQVFVVTTNFDFVGGTCEARTVFFENVEFLDQFPILNEKISIVVKTSIYLSRGTFWALFWKKFKISIFLALLSNILTGALKLAFLCFQPNNSSDETLLIFLKNFSLCFTRWAILFLLLLSKQLSPCPEQHFNRLKFKKVRQVRVFFRFFEKKNSLVFSNQ